MEKRNKKILLLSIFGGAALLIAVGYIAAIVWVIAKTFPQYSFKESSGHFIDLVKCYRQYPDRGFGSEADQKCMKDFVTSQRGQSIDKKREENPEYNSCMYEQSVLLEALHANKQQSEDVLNQQIAHYCDFQINRAEAISNTDIYSDYTALKLFKNDLASQAVLNYRYKFFKKKNYLLELEALDVYRKLVNTSDCAAIQVDIADLEKRGSIFILGTAASCKMKDCMAPKKTTCPEVVKLSKHMISLGDIAGYYMLSHEARLNEEQGLKALNYTRQALLQGYTDLASDYPELEEDFYKIKFTKDSLAFSAARLMNAAKVYTPALNCVAASLNKDWEFETLLKSPQTYSKQQWSEKITDWANENSELLLRVACEVLTDVESKKRIHEYYMNDGNEDGSAFDFCTMIQDPLFKEVCAEKAPDKNK